ncbi:hypothetical protein CIHG_07251 [Coccidioides immitis H538.4]|uniref:Uncharacterized protein n=3 Tax=Coccidioides immitis TaxID=5501 RepID=A0A0J8R9T6_COCIT|nr:hypothetical protein CIRG_09158 [Coccidioides immitis RMSCC 2394]KMU81180.1 hypothetical protein CISG_02557 [Coccidioides immitis RMSCC 3703]KMU89444.1 hypothetical protein CIHG_07251 [Coccidioides immitis H538.4]
MTQGQVTRSEGKQETGWLEVANTTGSLRGAERQRARREQGSREGKQDREKAQERNGEHIERVERERERENTTPARQGKCCLAGEGLRIELLGRPPFLWFTQVDAASEPR